MRVTGSRNVAATLAGDRGVSATLSAVARFELFDAETDSMVDAEPTVETDEER